MKAELVPDNGDPPIPISRDVTVIGRHPDCDVVINEPSLSKRHCVFVKTDGLLVLRDLATTNGTKVKGQKVRWAALLPDDKISLGGYKLRVYLGSDEMPSPSEQRRGRSGRGDVPSPGTDRSPPPQGRAGLKPAAISPSFPAPSYHDEALPPVVEMEIIGDNERNGAPRADQSDDRLPNFELIDDDDEIIELS